MIRFAADENFDNDIFRGVWRIEPGIDIVRVQDTAIAGADDPTLLEWLAQESRTLLSHDVNTIPGFAYQRVAEGKVMPEVFLVHSGTVVGLVAQDIVLMALCSGEHEWAGQVRYLPLR